MLYLRVNGHKRSCWLTVLEAHGHEVEPWELSMDRAPSMGRKRVA